MQRFTTKRLAAVAVTAGLVLGGGGVAFAYFTGNGSGTGHATTGTISGSDVTFAGSASGSPLFPGGGSQDVSFTAANGAGGTEYLGTVYITVASSGGWAIDNSSDTPVPITNCSASWYQLSESSVDVDLAVPGLTTTDPIPAGTVSMPGNSVDDQNACQGHQIELDFNTAT